MYKIKKVLLIVITIIMILMLGCIDVKAANNVNNNITINDTNDETNGIYENELNESHRDDPLIDNNAITEESSTSKLVDIKQEQLKSLDDYKKKYGSDTYGTVAYILHLVQVYSIPFGIVGIAFCAIYEYIIGMKRLDIRDKGFNSMIALITIIIICQILPLIFAVVVKSTD